jgi:transcriptional regulator with XRE-family HTH domain
LIKMDIIQNIRDNIYKELRKRNITLEEFCDKTNLSKEDVAKIILGEVLLPPYQIELIANVLGTTKQKIMYGKHWKIIKLLH